MVRTVHPPTGSPKLVLVAAILAAAAVVLMSLYIEDIRRKGRESSFTIYVLTKTMRVGDKLRLRDLEPVLVPNQFIEGFKKIGVILKDADRDDLAPRMGDTIKKTVPQGSLLVFEVFQEIDVNEAVQPRKGKRHLALPVNSKTVPGTLRPGMYVDIVGTFVTPSGRLVKPVMERVKVVAVGQRTVADESGSRRRTPMGHFNSIDVEVKPDEAINLSIIQRLAIGGFEVYTRNAADEDHPGIFGGGINPQVLELIESTVTSPAS